MESRCIDKILKTTHEWNPLKPKEEIGKEDMIGRVGGDEFAVLLTDTAHEDTQSLAKSIMDRVDSYSTEKQHIPSHCNFSISFAIVEPSSLTSRGWENVESAAYRLLSNACTVPSTRHSVNNSESRHPFPAHPREGRGAKALALCTVRVGTNN